MATPAENHDLDRCFACGRDNPFGLALRLRYEGGAAVADAVAGAEWVSWRGIVHGGLVATLMDEAMGWAVAARGWTSLTARLSVRLRAPVRPGEALQVRGWVREWGRRAAHAAAEVRGHGSAVAATAKAVVPLMLELPGAGGD